MNTLSLCKVHINEDITTRGLNSLFYQIEVDDTKGHRIRTISYQRTCVADMLHNSPVFEFFRKSNNKLVNKAQCDEYCNKLEQVICLLEQVSKIY